MSEEKRMVGSYEVEQSIFIGEKKCCLASAKEEYPFMVCYCDYDNPLSAPWYTRQSGRMTIWKQWSFSVTGAGADCSDPQ